MGDQPLTKDEIRFLCSFARLPLADDRCAALVQPLSTLVAAANELSARVAAAAGTPPSIPPIVGFPER
jgi:hypothetical protein